VLDHAMDFGVGDKGSMHALRVTGAWGEIQHVALTEQRLGTHLIENGRESILLATWNAMRDGILALIRPVMTSTEGRCVARIK